MNVPALGVAATANYFQSTQSTRPPLTNTAQLLGLSTDQLNIDMRSGTKLSSLATQNGLSTSALLSSVESDLQANAPANSTASSDRLKQIATSVIRGAGHEGNHRGGGGGGANGLARLLGTDGSTSADPTQPSSSALIGTAAPAGGTERSAGVSSSGGTPALGATSSVKATNNLNSLASATGLDPSSLLSRLQSGENLSSLLGSAGQTGYGSSVASSVTGGVMYDEYG